LNNPINKNIQNKNQQSDFVKSGGVFHEIPPSEKKQDHSCVNNQWNKNEIIENSTLAPNQNQSDENCSPTNRAD
jgi:hypothetical protein